MTIEDFNKIDELVEQLSPEFDVRDHQGDVFGFADHPKKAEIKFSTKRLRQEIESGMYVRRFDDNAKETSVPAPETEETDK